MLLYLIVCHTLFMSAHPETHYRRKKKRNTLVNILRTKMLAVRRLQLRAGKWPPTPSPAPQSSTRRTIIPIIVTIQCVYLLYGWTDAVVLSERYLHNAGLTPRKQCIVITVTIIHNGIAMVMFELLLLPRVRGIEASSVLRGHRPPRPELVCWVRVVRTGACITPPATRIEVGSYIVTQTNYKRSVYGRTRYFICIT